MPDKSKWMKQLQRFAWLIIILVLVSSCETFFKFRKAGMPSENDYKYFASRNIEAGTNPFRFHKANPDLDLGATIELDSRKIDASDEPLKLFLK
jgi:hypothetical protein